MFLSNLFGSFHRTAGKPARRSQRRAFRPRLEQLEGRLVPASFVWLNPWDVSPLVEGSTAFGNIGAAGDEGPAAAAASAYAFSSDGRDDVSVIFRRTFQLAGSPTGWKVTLDGLLSGSLTVHNYDTDAGSAEVTAFVNIFQGTPDAPGSVTHDLYFGWYGCRNGELNVSVPGTRQGVIPDGTYTVIGRLGAAATGYYGEFVGAAHAWSRFYTPPGLVTTIDAVPWNNQPAVSISDATFVEGNTGAVARYFTVALSNPWNQTVTVNYATADGSAISANDYTAASGTLTFAPGETSKTISVLVNGDRLGEPNETFFLNLNSPTNATIADGQGQGTILDDEPRVSINDVTITEGNSGLTAFAFTVSLSVAYDVPVTVGYATANGTATAGSDYQAASGTLTIPAGQTSGTITVLVNGDRLGEPNETFVVNLSNLNYGVIADGQGLGTIVDDEPRLSINDVTKLEGNSGTTLFVFTVSLSAAYDAPVTVNYATANGTATTADHDYQAQSGTLTFAPGETTKTITIVVYGDTKKEPKQSFFVNLSGAVNATILDGQGLGTILNDD